MTKIMVMEGSAEDLVMELVKTVLGDESLLGLDRKPGEGISISRSGDVTTVSTRSRKPSREDVLLTTRRDLLAVRERLLGRASRNALLRDIDYTIDQLDNVLGEM